MYTGTLPYSEPPSLSPSSGLGALSGVSELDCLRFQMSSVSVHAVCTRVRSAAGVEHFGAFAPAARLHSVRVCFLIVCSFLIVCARCVFACQLHSLVRLSVALGR